MNKELKADINNKLQAPLTALSLLAEDKPVPKKFIETAIKSLQDAKEMLNESKD